MARPTLRLIHSHDSADDLMFKANALLAARRPREALNLYTKILYQKSPGHICAFLNRALAYSLLGYPELAVVDAYRALVLLGDLQNRRRVRGVNIADIQRYVRAEWLHLKTGDPWTSAPDCYAGLGWLSMPLASILLNDKDVYGRLEIPWVGYELRALFRICGALWQCGGGALSDALGMIDDVLAQGSALRQYNGYTEELRCFRELGDLIIKDICHLHSDDPTMLKALMKLKVTLVNKVIYPWNHHEPDLGTFAEVESLEKYADDSAKPCTVKLVGSSATEAVALRLIAARDIYPNETVLSETSVLQVTTAAPGDITGFFCDVCAAAMVTSEELRRKTLAPQPRSWESAASVGSGSRLLSPDTVGFSPDHWTGDLPTGHSPPKGPNFAPSADCASQTSSAPVTANQIVEVESLAPLDFTLYPDAKEASAEIPRELSSGLTSSDLELTPDFQICSQCCEAPCCSSDCFRRGGDFHTILCTSGVEDGIRSTYLHSFERLKKSVDDEASHTLFVHPKARCLYDLLLVRIIALAADKDVNPLELSEIRWLNGDLLPRPTPHEEEKATIDMYSSSSLPLSSPVRNTKHLPWTFTNNVIRPIQYLREIGLDSMTTLDRCDGWIMNTLYAKIMHSTRISTPRHAKVYDHVGKLVSEQFPVDEEKIDQSIRAGSIPTSPLPGKPPRPVKKSDQDVWVGTLHTVFAMVGVADETKGETANVATKNEGTVKCLPVPRQNAGGDCNSDKDVDMGRMEGERLPCIKAGDYILRANEEPAGVPIGPIVEEGDSLDSWIGNVQRRLRLSMGEDEGDEDDNGDRMDSTP
ncbi:MAG: hypothetical protein Q9187_001879 [Circinaria calcarea]